MPWTQRSAIGHTRKANTPDKQRVWSEVANRILEKTGDDASAVRQANAVIGRIRTVRGRKKTV